MRAIDSNVLVRLLTQDDPAQSAAAAAFIEPGAWISHVVLVEAAWVLGSVYNRSPVQIASGIEKLLGHDRLVVQDADVVTAALTRFRSRPSIGFSDCLVLEIARKAGHLPLGTFDRSLAKLDGVQSV